MPGLLVIGPLQNFGGWKAVWYFLMASTIAGMALLAPLVHKEIFNHDGDVRQKTKERKSLLRWWPLFSLHQIARARHAATLKI